MMFWGFDYEKDVVVFKLSMKLISNEKSETIEIELPTKFANLLQTIAKPFLVGSTATERKLFQPFEANA